MAVEVFLLPASSPCPPGAVVGLTLRLHNRTDAQDVVRIATGGPWASRTVLQSETVYLEADETLELPVTVDVDASATAGVHAVEVVVTTQTGDVVAASSAVDVEAVAASNVSLVPVRSASASSGRHRLAVENTGNVPLRIEIDAVSESPEHTAEVRVAAPVVDVEPGASARVEVRLLPRSRFWSGDVVDHPFTIVATGSDGRRHELAGVWQQGPRLRPWYLPALAGAALALSIGAIAWFGLLRPAVRDIADERAEIVNDADRDRLNDKIAQLDAAAADAAELPLGTPADLRLEVAAATGVTADQSYAVASDRVLSVTDIVFQNPDGAVGRVALMRSGVVLLESELANFRDLDLHFVAPFRFEANDTVDLRVECRTPGPDTSECNVSATVIGFVDTID